MLPIKTRYIVFKPAAVVGVQKISIKIPEDFVLCDGVHVTSGRVGVGVKPSGTISLSFNNKASNPILLNFGYGTNYSTTRKTKFLEIKEPLTGGTYIQGYIDFATTGAGSYFKLILKGKKVYRNG